MSAHRSTIVSGDDDRIGRRRSYRPMTIVSADKATVFEDKMVTVGRKCPAMQIDLGVYT
jgi:hypothetical protein